MWSDFEYLKNYTNSILLYSLYVFILFLSLIIVFLGSIQPEWRISVPQTSRILSRLWHFTRDAHYAITMPVMIYPFVLLLLFIII